MFPEPLRSPENSPCILSPAFSFSHEFYGTLKRTGHPKLRVFWVFRPRRCPAGTRTKATWGRKLVQATLWAGSGGRNRQDLRRRETTPVRLFQEVFNTLGVEHTYAQFLEVRLRSASQSLLRPTRHRAEALFDLSAKDCQFTPFELPAEHLIIK